MGKPKYDPPSTTFPYKITKRLNKLSVPRPYIIDTGEGMPAVTAGGVRKSALRCHISDRVNDASWPSTRRFLLLKRQYKTRFSPERLERIDRMIELANATPYSKLANCVLDLKKQDTKEVKKKRGWSESEWKKHMDYIGQIAGPKPDFTVEEPRPGIHLCQFKITQKRGPRKPLEALMPRINQMSVMPPSKVYRRLSQDPFYRDPVKVPPKALQYVISDRVKKLAAHRVIQENS